MQLFFTFKKLLPTKPQASRIAKGQTQNGQPSASMFYYLYTFDKYLEQKQNNYNNFKIDDIKNITTAKYKISQAKSTR